MAIPRAQNHQIHGNDFGGGGSATRAKFILTIKVNPVHTRIGAQRATQFCSTASNVGECMLNLTTVPTGTL